MSEQTAKLYADHRPYFHEIIADRLQARIGVPIGSALDVACGTGQSTDALRDFAQHIVGIDISPAMLTHAPRTVSRNWVIASAERLPFAADCFDLVTVGLAYHWFDQGRFLMEAERVLRPGGHLVIYNNGFRGRMSGDDTFATWFTSAYLGRFPSPPRASAALTGVAAAQRSLCLEHQEKFSNVVDFSLDELVGYLTSQSNVAARIQNGHETLDEIQQWLSTTLLTLFGAGRRSFLFGGWIWYLSKPATV